jgi:hypothetical protein
MNMDLMITDEQHSSHREEGKTDKHIKMEKTNQEEKDRVPKEKKREKRGIVLSS